MAQRIRNVRSENHRRSFRGVVHSAVSWSYVPLALILSAGVGLSALAFATVGKWHSAQTIAELERMSSIYANVLQGETNQHLDVLTSLAAFYQASHEVDRGEFQAFTHHILRTHPGIRSLQWVSRVMHSQRSEFERKTRDEGFEDFEIRELGPDGRLSPASSRAQYFPIHYVEPFPENERAFGLDMGSDTAVRSTLTQALEANQPLLTGPVRLAREPNEGAELLLVYPVYVKGVPNTTVAQRRDNLLGFLVGAYGVDDIIAKALWAVPPGQLAFRVYDEREGSSERLLYDYAPGRGYDTEELWRGPARKASFSAKALTVPGRTWTVVFRPSTADRGWAGWEQQWMALFVGLVLTGILALYLFGALTRARKIENQVAARTAELAKEVAVRKDVEVGLRDSEARARAVIDTAVDGVILIDSAGLIRRFNPACEGLFGYPAEEVLNQNVSVLMPKPYCREHDAYLRNYLRTGHRKIIGIGREVEGRRKDGSVFPMELSVGEVQQGDERTFVGIVRDITERKRAKEEAEQGRRAAEAASQAKSEFLATMSHEIRTPMNGVLGMTQLLQQTQLNEEQAEYVHIIDQSGRGLLTLIDDILDFSKVEAGRLELETLAFDLEQVAGEIVQLLSARANEKGLELLLHVDSQCPRYLIGDVGRIRQVLTNLVGNAVKFTERGHVLVDIACVNCSENQAEVRLSVEDTGIGIAPQNQSRLFQAFTQADNSTTRKFGGTGLGLAICKRLVDLMGGEINVKSSLDEGSAFRVTLTLPIASGPKPVDEAAVSGAAPPVVGDNEPSSCAFNAPLANGRSVFKSSEIASAQSPQFFGHVLVAEDIVANQIVARSMLKKLGLEVDVAANGKEALEKSRVAHYGLIFMDCQMPEMDGYEATRQIRSREQSLGHHIPIVALTANALAGERDKCYEAGMDDFVTKPFDRADLVSALLQWLPPQLSDSPDASVERSCTDGGECDGTLRTGARAVDRDTLQMMRETLGEDFTTMVAAYLEGASSMLEQLAQAHQSADFDTLERLAHSLKSSSLHVGAVALSDQARELEERARSGTLGDAEGRIAALRSEYESVREALSMEPDITGV